MKRTVLLIAVLGLVAAACGNDDTAGPTTTGATTTTTAATTTTTQPATTTTSEPMSTVPPDCSAASLSSGPVAQDLPEPVAATRAAIVAAATACDYEALAALVGDPFTYSFGDGGDPAAFWRQIEDTGQATPLPLRALVELLDMPYGTIEADATTYYVWPAAFTYNSWDAVPEVDREYLRDLYTEQDFQSFADFGGYVGYRVGITADGTWTFFVAGD